MTDAEWSDEPIFTYKSPAVGQCKASCGKSIAVGDVVVAVGTGIGGVAMPRDRPTYHLTCWLER